MNTEQIAAALRARLAEVQAEITSSAVAAW